MRCFILSFFTFLLAVSLAGAVCVDNDEDTYVGDVTQGCPTTVDCDDSDETTYPGAAEACDNVDNNCDGEVDEGCSAGVEDAPPNTSQEQAPLVPPNCELGDATFLDSAGTVADIASEGDSLFLSVSATSCENAEVSFIVLEYDGNDPLTGELLVDVVDDAAVSLVLNGVAAVEWPVSYVDDELEYDAYGFEDSFPEYLLFAAIDREEGVIAANPSEILKVVAWGEGEFYTEEDLYYPPADVTDDSAQDFLEAGDYDDSSQVFSGSEDAGLEDEGLRNPADFEGVLVECGDGFCDDGEGKDSCPDDCAGSNVPAIVFTISILLAALTTGVVLATKKIKSRKTRDLQVEAEEEAKKKAEQATQSQQFYEQFLQGRMQVQPRYMQQNSQPSLQQIVPQVQVRTPPQAAQQQPTQQAPLNNQQERLKKAVSFAYHSRKQGMQNEQIKGLMLSVGFTEQEAQYALSMLQNMP
ncbi:putative metal-binding motif-containing protein [Candidatus Woesearchaeota archaeon]|nr:putative metal-binding motif-containing protein [Candidatus Woesearchaeota archaeon]